MGVARRLGPPPCRRGGVSPPRSARSEQRGAMGAKGGSLTTTSHCSSAHSRYRCRNNIGECGMRWIIRGIASVVALALLVVIGLLLLPGDKIARVAVDQLKVQTGREVILKGETRISYYPVLGVATGAVEIANANWSKAGPLLTADSLKVGVDFAALIGGEIKIIGLEAVNPSILLERAKDGRANWELGVEGVSASGQPSGASNPLALSLDRALITGGSLRYLDHGSKGDVSVTELGLDLRWPAYRGKAEFTLQGRLPEAPLIKVSGSIGDLAALIEGQITALNFDLETKGGSLGYEGRFGTPVQAQGQLSLDVSNSTSFLSAFGQTGVALPAGFGQSLNLSTQATFTQKMQLSLRKLALSSGQHRVTGELDLDLAPKVPFLTAKLVTNVIKLPTTSNDTAARAPATTSGWSNAPIDASALALINADIALNLEGIDANGLRFGAATLRATVDRARAVVQLQKMAGYSGSLSGQVVANNRSGLSVGGDLKATGLELQDLLQDLIGVDRFTGQANATVNFLAVGQSLNAIMHSLSGNGALAMGRGTIKGIDLDRLMRSGVSSGGTTVFDAFSASFTVKDGDLSNNDLLLELPVISASGSGRVGLGAQDIDYLFTPKTGASNTAGGVAIPVRIRGPWSGPKVWPDLEKAIDLNLKAEKEAAKQKLEEKVKKELGLQQNQGESLEDAAKRKLEGELLKGLGKIFQ